MARGFENGRNATLEEDQIFGRLVAVRRAALGLSQEDLAARMATSQANVVGIENGRPPSLETLDQLAVALAAEPRTGSAWSSRGGRWGWGGLAIAVLVPAFLILNGRSGESDRSPSPGHAPEVASPAPVVSPPVVQVDAHGNPLTLRQSGRETKGKEIAHNETARAVPGQEDAGAGVERPRRSAPEVTLAPTSPAEATPNPPSAAPSPQPSGSGGASAPPKPTGKPDGSPGNGPGGGGTGGGGGSGGGGSGGGGSGGGNGPGGTGPPGQLP